MEPSLDCGEFIHEWWVEAARPTQLPSLVHEQGFFHGWSSLGIEIWLIQILWYY